MKQKVSKTIKYYVRVWLQVVKVSMSRMAAYRIEVITRAMRGVFVVAVQIIFANAIAGNARNYLGYSVDQIYLLAGFFNLIGYVSWALFGISLGRLEEKIAKGEFDFILFKPMSSIFGASFMEFFIDDAATAVSGLALIGYYIIIHHTSVSILSILMAAIAAVCGVLIWFSMDLIVSSFDFIALRTGLRNIRERMNAAGRFPTDVWGSNSQFIFYTIFPIAFIGFVPAKLLLDASNFVFLGYSIIATIAFLFIARTVWYLALRKYTSVN